METTSALGLTAIIFIGVLYFIVLRPAYGRGYVSLTGTTPLESRFFEDLHKGRRGDWSLAEGFFIASGIREEKSLKRAKEWLDQLTIEVEKHLKTERSTDERADQLLRWLHSKVFSEYQASATDALALLRSGRYNCLSSCILYAIIGERIGLNIKGIAVDKHAFCRVLKTARSKRGWDVETTVALGFNPGRNVKISNTVISVPRSQYRNRKELNMWEMIGLIYTNHMGMTGAFPTLKDKLLAFKKAALFSPRDELIQKNVRSVYLMMIQELTREAEIGKLYLGVVKRCVDFGAFIEIFPGTEGLVHISHLANERVDRTTDVVNEGDEVLVRVIEIDRRSGKIRLSRKEALEAAL